MRLSKNGMDFVWCSITYLPSSWTLISMASVDWESSRDVAHTGNCPVSSGKCSRVSHLPAVTVISTFSFSVAARTLRARELDRGFDGVDTQPTDGPRDPGEGQSVTVYVRSRESTGDGQYAR
jgi:hypothetical protein